MIGIKLFAIYYKFNCIVILYINQYLQTVDIHFEFECCNYKNK